MNSNIMQMQTPTLARTPTLDQNELPSTDCGKQATVGEPQPAAKPPTCFVSTHLCCEQHRPLQAPHALRHHPRGADTGLVHQGLAQPLQRVREPAMSSSQCHAGGSKLCFQPRYFGQARRKRHASKRGNGRPSKTT